MNLIYVSMFFLLDQFHTYNLQFQGIILFLYESISSLSFFQYFHDNYLDHKLNSLP